MAQILSELYYLDAALEPLSLHIRDSMIQSNRKLILQKHQINDTDFIESSLYYKNRKSDMDQIRSMVNELFIKKGAQEGSDIKY